MGKRDALEDEEQLTPSSESPSALSVDSPANKRPRLDSPLPASSPPPLPTDDDLNPEKDADEQSDDDDDDVEEDDEEEKQRNEEEVARMRASQKMNGKIAEAGVIEMVTLHNFMCHKYCEIKFGPQINFLVGHNGSGKSAVLTGISMALGGNAKATSRANKTGSLVKDGESFALCQVKIKNVGVDAHQPKTYGKSITIERRINKDLGGNYKVKDHAGKVVDTRRSTLDAILDHFNIQVDNPMTVLTQDQSRQFLANATPKDKYNFFLRGTQLAQLTEEYEVIRHNTEQMQDSLEKKKEVLPELKESYKFAKTRAKEAQAAATQKDRIDELKHELAWSYVVEVEDKIKNSDHHIQGLQRTAERIEEHLAKFQAEEEKANAAAAAMREAQAGLDDVAGTEELARIAREISDLRNEMKEFGASERDAVSRQKSLHRDIAEFERKLAAEQAKLDRNASRQKQPIIDKIAKLRDDQSKVQMQAVQARSTMEQVDDERRALGDDFHNAKSKIDDARQLITDAKGRIHSAQQSTKNKLYNYHNRMPDLVRAIEREARNFQQAPIGPVGAYVKLRDMRYSKTLEAVLAHTLNAFVVQNERDKQLLSRLQKQVGTNVPVIKAAHDPNFDCSSGEPQSDVLTIRRVLEISDPLLDQMLVISLHIEKGALVPHRKEGDELMRARLRNVESCFSADGFRLSGGSGGGSATASIDDWKGAGRLNPDATSLINRLQEEIGGHEQALDSFQQDYNKINRTLTDLTNQYKTLESSARDSDKKAQGMTREINRLNEQLRDEEPSNVAAIEEEVKQGKEELASITAQLSALQETKKTVNGKVEPLHQRKKEIEEEVAKATEHRRKLQKRLETEEAKEAESKSHSAQYTKKLAEKVAEIKVHEEDLQRTNRLLEERHEQASSVCDRPVVEKKKSVQKLTHEIDALEKVIKAQEAKQGATLEQILDKLDERQAAYQTAVKATNELHNFIALLARAYETRLHRWTDFRDAISNRAKMQFLFHLSNRGYTGKLHFDHDKNRLNLRVQTDDATVHGTKGRQKDAKSLSGGEKSFSTICLLLTMWEAVGCPLRCLDEFDVFMDAVNRRISMKMMVDTARGADCTQFILITPQAMTEVKFGPEVRVNRMHDPNRNNGVLAFGT